MNQNVMNHNQAGQMLNEQSHAQCAVKGSNGNARAHCEEHEKIEDALNQFFSEIEKSKEVHKSSEERLKESKFKFLNLTSATCQIQRDKEDAIEVLKKKLKRERMKREKMTHAKKCNVRNGRRKSGAE